METEQNSTSDNAGRKGSGFATGGDEGLDHGTEPEGGDARDAERP